MTAQIRRALAALCVAIALALVAWLLWGDVEGLAQAIAFTAGATAVAGLVSLASELTRAR